MKQLSFQRTYIVTSLVLFLWWAALLPCGIGVCGSAAVVIVGDRLTRSVVDCEKYVFHPHCRGLQAKKKRLFNSKNLHRAYDEYYENMMNNNKINNMDDDNDGINNNYNTNPINDYYNNNNNNNNINNNDNMADNNNNNNNNKNDKTDNLCVCKYLTKSNNSWQKDLQSIGLAKLFKEVMPTLVIVNEKGQLVKNVPILNNNIDDNNSNNEPDLMVPLSTVVNKINMDNLRKIYTARNGPYPHYQQQLLSLQQQQQQQQQPEQQQQHQQEMNTEKRLDKLKTKAINHLIHTHFPVYIHI